MSRDAAVTTFLPADDGTSFQDEVGKNPSDLQGKLLPALQEREFERVGDDRMVRGDVRGVALALLGVKPSTLICRMKVLDILKPA